MNIHSKADKLRRRLKNGITLPSVVRYAEKLGYSVLFGNTEETNTVLRRFELNDYACGKKAFTYIGVAKFIYVDDTCSEQDKLYLILHELGHITENADASLAPCDSVREEVRADAFAYEVVTGEQAHATRRMLCASLLAVFLSMFALFTAQPKGRSDSLYVCRESFEQNAEAVPVAEYVYILPSGTKYHAKDCRFVTSSAVSVLREELPDSYASCKVCHPDEAS